jgi:hypothetical protein
VLAHLSSLPVYGLLSSYLAKNPLAYSFANALFFDIRLPSIVLQIVVQVPFMMFAWFVARGRIARPERPVFTKIQFLLVSGNVFFLFIGSMFSQTTAGSYFLGIYFFYFLFFFLGISGILIITPKQLLYLQGLRKTFKLNKKRISFWDDHATNLGWLVPFALLCFCAFFFLHQGKPFSFGSGQMMRWLLIFFFISWFAGALEYFRLSAFHKKPSYFIVIITFLWVFIPLFGLMISPLLPAYKNMVYFLMASPIFPLLPAQPFAHMGIINLKQCITMAFVINLILMLVSFTLAAKARKKHYYDVKKVHSARNI